MNNCIWNYINAEDATVKVLSDYQKQRKLYAISSKENLSNTSELDKFRYLQSKEFLDWFEPAWNCLSEQNKNILKEFYMKGNLKSGAGTRLQFSLNYSERQLHRIRACAVKELAFLLFGTH